MLVPCSRDSEKLLSWRGSCQQISFDIQAYMFSLSAIMIGSGGTDERITLLEEMYNRICEENGPADPVLRIVSRVL
jgi:hypothetical protein